MIRRETGRRKLARRVDMSQVSEMSSFLWGPEGVDPTMPLTKGRPNVVQGGRKFSGTGELIHDRKTGLCT